MEDQYKVCKICNKSFKNGKALGGHIRSHLAEKKKKKMKMKKNSEFSTTNENKISEFETMKEMEDFAVWTLVEMRVRESVSKTVRESIEREHRLEQRRRNQERSRFEEGSSSSSSMVVQKKAFRCEICNREFRTYQALGGHKANHKKVMLRESPSFNEKDEEIEDIEEEEEEVEEFIEKKKIPIKKLKIFQCEFCGKVFGSGQALGGHKKSHFSDSDDNNNNNNNIEKKKNKKRKMIVSSDDSGSLLIDLNFPPVTTDNNNEVQDHQDQPLL